MRNGTQHVTHQCTRTVAEAAHAGRQIVDHYPLPAALTVFGLGIAVGLAVATSLASAQHAQNETLGRRISQQVQETLARILPDAMAKHVS